MEKINQANSLKFDHINNYIKCKLLKISREFRLSLQAGQQKVDFHSAN